MTCLQSPEQAAREMNFKAELKTSRKELDCYFKVSVDGSKFQTGGGWRLKPCGRTFWVRFQDLAPQSGV